MFINELIRIIKFVIQNFLEVWPLLILTVPLALAIRRVKVTDKVNGWLMKNIHISILAATLIGAVAPFCSCSVIPVISSMLLAGVPLAPIMAFWLASPSMDPEIFFLSAASLGYPLAIGRIVTTFFMSFGGGYMVYILLGKVNGQDYLKQSLKHGSEKNFNESSCQGEACREQALSCCEIKGPEKKVRTHLNRLKPLIKDSIDALLLIGRFLLIAYILEAIIIFYIPGDFITNILGGQGFLGILKATAISIPLYTTNLSALGLVGGLIEKGFSEGAGLAFLIGGATTTVPAMSAVYQLVRKKVFFIYLMSAIGFSLVGGLVYSLIAHLWN